MVTRCRTVVWLDHHQDGLRYCLKHLHPTYVVYKRDGGPGRSATHVRVRVEYSHHCFSVDATKLADFNPDHVYLWEVRPNDPRVFCPFRWELSKLLPELLLHLDKRSCYATRRRNHFAVRRNHPSGHYVLYFRVERKVTGGADIRLFVESAYHRDDFEEILATAERTSLLNLLLKV